MGRTANGDGGSETNRVLARAEWIVAALGGIFLLCAVGYLGWYAVAHGNGRPSVSVRAVSIVHGDGQYTVRFEARNDGDATAAGLLVEGRLRRGEETIEEAEATLDYLPGRSSRQGGLIFSQDPSAFRLVLGAKGYHDP